MYDLTFGIGVTMMALLGIVVLIVAIFGKKQVGSAKGLLMAIGIVALLLAGVTYVSGVYEPATEQIIPDATYDISCAEAEAELSVVDADHVINWAITYNTTSNAFTSSTGAGTLNFTVAWASGDEGAVNLAIGAVPYDPDGAANLYLVDQNADDTFNVLFTKLNAADTALVTAYEEINVYIDVADSEWASCVITLDAASLAAVAAADELTSWDLPITVAGEIWSVHFVLYDVIT